MPGPFPDTTVEAVGTCLRTLAQQPDADAALAASTAATVSGLRAFADRIALRRRFHDADTPRRPSARRRPHRGALRSARTRAARRHRRALAGRHGPQPDRAPRARRRRSALAGVRSLQRHARAPRRSRRWPPPWPGVCRHHSPPGSPTSAAIATMPPAFAGAAAAWTADAARFIPAAQAPARTARRTSRCRSAICASGSFPSAATRAARRRRCAATARTAAATRPATPPAPARRWIRAGRSAPTAPTPRPTTAS